MSEFNAQITERLLKGAIEAFKQHGGDQEKITIYKVPGAFEISPTIKQIINYHKPSAIIAIGSVIRGKTPHFDYVAGESARCLADLNLSNDIPIINGILTTDNKIQALDRSQDRGINK